MSGHSRHGRFGYAQTNSRRAVPNPPRMVGPQFRDTTPDPKNVTRKKTRTSESRIAKDMGDVSPKVMYPTPNPPRDHHELARSAAFGKKARCRSICPMKIYPAEVLTTLWPAALQNTGILRHKHQVCHAGGQAVSRIHSPMAEGIFADSKLAFAGQGRHGKAAEEGHRDWVTFPSGHGKPPLRTTHRDESLSRPQVAVHSLGRRSNPAARTSPSESAHPRRQPGFVTP